MKIFFCTSILLILFSCGRIENSSSLDKSIYSAAPTGSVAFTTVNTILRAKCSQCHGAWSSYSENDFVNNGLVVRASISQSKLYYRNQPATVGPGPHNMPSGGYPTLTTSEMTDLENWINAL